MFFWVEVPASIDTTALLPRAVDHGMAYVPGAAFFAEAPKANCLRLSFVTVPPGQIEQGIVMLADALKECL
jgi:2-aminoadipate transaminase